MPNLISVNVVSKNGETNEIFLNPRYIIYIREYISRDSGETAIFLQSKMLVVSETMKEIKKQLTEKVSIY